MKLIIPHCEDGLASEVREFGESLGARFEVTPRADTTAYFALFESLWAEGEPFMIVEGDVLPRAEMLREMWDCREDEWCHGYWTDPPMSDKHSQWLGCARFSESLLQRAPDIMSRVAEHAQEKHWNQLDICLWYSLRAIRDGRGPHLHNPPVVHLHREMEARRR